MVITLAGLSSFAKGFGSVASGLGSIGSMFGLGSSGGTSLYKTAKLMHAQNKLDIASERLQTKWHNLNDYSFMRKGLERAGYNPLMALGASPTTASENVSASQLPVGSTASFNPAQGIEALATLAQIENTKADTQNKKFGVLGSRILNWWNAIRGKDNTANVIEGATNKVEKLLDIKGAKSTAQQFAKDTGLDEILPDLPSIESVSKNTAKAVNNVKKINSYNKSYYEKAKAHPWKSAGKEYLKNAMPIPYLIYKNVRNYRNRK